jgi:hypothetical protein
LTVESNEYAAAVATAVEATMARVMGAAAAAERAATEETARTPVEERVATLREAVEARERVAAENMVKVCQSWSIDFVGMAAMDGDGLVLLCGAEWCEIFLQKIR